jgi:S-formylglutathione hydrolase FrmB
VAEQELVLQASGHTSFHLATENTKFVSENSSLFGMQKKKTWIFKFIWKIEKEYVNSW